MRCNIIEMKENPFCREQAMEECNERYALLIHQNEWNPIQMSKKPFKKRLTRIQRLLACVSRRK